MHLLRLSPGATCPATPIANKARTYDQVRLAPPASESRPFQDALSGTWSNGMMSVTSAEAMRSTAPGVNEYELAAVALLKFLLSGARGEGYRAIVATGTNAWHGHYFRLASTLKDGELLLYDYAPDFRYYTSDIGRMWPVNGTFTKAQRALYGYIVEYHQTLLRLLKPGASPRDVLDVAAEEMRLVLEKTTFAEPHHARAARTALEFRGHLSHPVGMAVHDVGEYRSGKLEPGMVISVDPKFWIPEDRLYIRCEDTILVTDNGVEVLTAGAPLGPDATEQTMREIGMLQSLRG